MEAVFCRLAARHIDLSITLGDYWTGNYKLLAACDGEVGICDVSCPCYVFTKKKKGV